MGAVNSLAWGGRPAYQGGTPNSRLAPPTSSLSSGGVDWVGASVKCTGVTKYGLQCKANRVQGQVFCAGHMKSIVKKLKEAERAKQAEAVDA